MTIKNESHSIVKEVEELLLTHGIQPTSRTQSKLNAEEYRKLRELAMGVVYGPIPVSQIRELSTELSSELAIMISRLIALKGSPPVQDIRERNPYYGALKSRIVRDGNEE